MSVTTRAPHPADPAPLVPLTRAVPTPDGQPVADTMDDLRGAVKERYGSVAQRVLQQREPAAASCCSPSPESSGCCGATGERWDPITADLYDQGEVAGIPADALLASLGCGNPTALAALQPGETVLDLGSGGGIDVLLSARRVGPAGKAYGLDMTDDMLALARENAAAANATNVEFIKGHIEDIPLPDASVDVIISNCVINLSGDKRRVLQEAFRVLKPGGRFAVSDVLVRGDLPADVRASMGLWTGCIAGALDEEVMRTYLGEVGFVDIDIEPTRVYSRDECAAMIEGTGVDVAHADAVDGRVMSAFIRAAKPA